MKKITQEEFDKFPIVYGIKQCPAGDYANFSSFAGWCSFAEGCYFAGWCSFAKGCSFAGWCSFAEGCSFAKGCSFAEGCSFAKGCSFAEGCSFAKGCSFAEECSFAKGCSFENKQIPLSNQHPFISIDKIGSRKAKVYFWNFKNGIFVRAGCYYDSIDNFKNRVKEIHDGTIYEQEYLLAIDFAEKIIALKNKEV